MTDTAMRITLISGSLPEMPCGVGDYTARLASALATEGASVRIVTTRDDRVASLPAVSVDLATRNWGTLQVPMLLRAARRGPSDVVHMQYPTVGYRHGLAPALLLSALRLLSPGMPLVLTLHEYVHLAPLHRAFVAGMALWAHAAITPDRAQLQGLRRAPRSVIEEIPLASNIRPIASTGARKQSSELVVGSWGMLRPDKGLDVLIDAFAEVARVRSARLIIAGDPGPDSAYADHLRTLASASAVGDRITFTGRLGEAELSEALSEFDVCVLPYVAGLEANRGTYAAAVAHGLSIVATTTGDPGYDARTNTTLVHVEDRTGLVNGIFDAAARPRLPLVDVDLEWRLIAQRHLEIYRDLLTTRNRGRT